ncbi:MAG: hypothetical protein ACKVOE_07930 [Rickettsiales bacterium]
MKMKQIRAASMQDALALARRELGEGAVLLDSKKDEGKGIIVTFAIDADDIAIAPDEADNGFDPADILPFSPHIPKPSVARINFNHPALEMIAEALAFHQLPAGLNDQLLARLPSAQLRPDSIINVAEAALAYLLGDVLKFNPIATAGKFPAKALMLVGPHGAGKSSAIAKLATELTLHKQRITLISTDTEKMSGTDHLAKLAEILKCPFHIGENRAGVKALLAEPAAQGWVLIDSAGVNIYEFKELKSLGEIAGLHGVEPILTMPAGLDAHEAAEMASVFSFLPIERMLITRTDAVRRLSGVFAALGASGYALANLSSSASPSDSCSAFSPACLARLMLRQTRERMHA